MHKILPLLFLLVGAAHSLFDDDDEYIIEYVPRMYGNMTLPHQNRLGIKQMMDIWDRSDDDDDRPAFIIEQESAFRTPHTIIAVMNQQMSHALPSHEYNPFFDDENRRLRTEFVLDQLSIDKINFDDPRLFSPFGMHMRAMSGDDYFFTSNPHTGVLSLNDVEIESFEHFDDDTDVIVLSNFLFNHAADIRRAKANPPPKRQLVDRHGRPIGKPKPKPGNNNSKRPNRRAQKPQQPRHQSVSQRFAQGHHHGGFPFPGIIIRGDFD